MEGLFQSTNFRLICTARHVAHTVQENFLNASEYAPLNETPCTIMRYLMKFRKINSMKVESMKKIDSKIYHLVILTVSVGPDFIFSSNSDPP